MKGFAITTYLLSQSNSQISLMLEFSVAAVVFVFIYLIAELILRRRIKLIIKGLVKLPAHLGIVFVFIIVFATGYFGFSSRVPDVESIKSVQMSYVGSPNYNGYSLGGRTGNDGYYDISAYTYTSELSIETVTALHRELIKAGKNDYSQVQAGKIGTDVTVPYEVLVKYTLKDGSTLTRYYDRTTVGVLSDMLGLDDTQEIRENISNTLLGKTDASTISSVSSKGKIYLYNNMLSYFKLLQLDENKRALLLEAIDKDLSSQTIEDRYYPKSPELGEIVFYNGTEQEPRFESNSNNLSIFVTEKFTNTLDFLKNNGLMNDLNVMIEIESISFKKFNQADYNVFNRNVQAKSLYFMAYKIYGNMPYFGDAKLFTDQSQISSVLPLLRSNYFASGGGYMAIVKLKGSSTYVYKFLPTADAPQFVRDTVK